MDEAGIYQSPRYVFSKNAIEAIRLKTFNHWPKQIKQTPKELAGAGFYYTGLNDSVVCFCCKMGAHSWEKKDDPWEQHAKYTENCSFLTLMKGQKYIDKVKAKFKLSQVSSTASSNISPPSPPASLELMTLSVNETCCERFEEKLRETRLCKMCCSNECNTVFIPCGHILSCVQCSFAVKLCPFCRQPIIDVIKAYFT